MREREAGVTGESEAGVTGESEAGVTCEREAGVTGERERQALQVSGRRYRWEAGVTGGQEGVPIVTSYSNDNIRLFDDA